jgi:AbrB family looped-hinge helix DNA binding protein
VAFVSYSVNISPNGRISLPIAIRKKLGVADGGALLLDETPNGIVLRTVAQSLANAREIAKNAKDASAEDFLAQRRKDSGE